MPKLVDIGGGNKVLSFEDEPSPVEAFKNQLGLMDLVNRVEAAPLQRQAQEYEIALKKNQVTQMAITNAANGLRVLREQLGLQSDQMKYTHDALNNIQDAFRINPKAGELMAKEAMPGSETLKNPDGTYSVKIGQKLFTVDPNNVAEPEKKAEIARNYRNDWVKSTEAYSIKSQAFNNVKNSITSATKEGDITSLYNLIKLIEPGAANAVREGELALYTGNNNSVRELINLWNKQVTQDSPVFGGAGSKQRSNMLNEASSVYESLRKSTVEGARFFYGVAERNGIKPLDVLQPPGDFTAEELLRLAAPAQKPQPIDPRPPQSTQPKPIPGSPEATSTPIQSSPTYEQQRSRDLYHQGLGDAFGDLFKEGR